MNTASETLADPASLLSSLEPTLRAVVSRFPRETRGSVDVEDLRQVAAIEALKFAEKYDPARASARAPLSDHVYRRALRACMEHVRMHSASVNVSDWARRGRSKKEGARPRMVGVEEAEGRTDEATPETLLLDADVARTVAKALGRLDAYSATLVRQVFGIGCEAKSVAELAREQRMPRRRLDDALRGALTGLRNLTLA